MKRLGGDVYPDTGSPYSSFRSVVFADASVDHFPDALVTLWYPPQSEGVAVCQWGAGIYDGAMEANWGASTPYMRYVATVKGVTPTAKDIYAYTSSSGLGVIYYHQGASEGFFGDVLTAAYPNATLVGAGQFGGGAAPDIVFVNGGDLRVLEDINMTTTITNPFDAFYTGQDRLLKSGLGTVYDLEVLNWDVFVNNQEIAVVSSSGTYVYNYQGTTLASWAYSGSLDRIAPLRYGAVERLVCVYVSSGWKIVELRPGSAFSTFVALPVPPGSFLGLGAGDFNADGLPDVGINYSSSTKMLIYNDGTTAKPFKAANILPIDLNGADPDFSDPTDNAEPKFFDVDFDGDDDMTIGWHNPEGMGELTLVSPTVKTPRSQSPENVGPLGGYAPCSGSNVTRDTTTGKYWVTLYFNAPSVWPINIVGLQNDGQDGDDVVRMEFVVWRLTNANSGANATAVARGIKDVDFGNLANGHVYDADDPDYWSVMHYKVPDDFGAK